MPGIPVPNAGPDQSFAYAGAPFNVQLAGNGTDPDGFPILSWQWTLVYKPVGSAAIISNPTTQNPVLTGVDLEGTYEPFLQVTSQNGSSAAASVPVLFGAVDAAFVHIIHRTQNQDWRVPARYERSWTERINSILFDLDDKIAALAPNTALYLLNGAAPAQLPNAVDVTALAASLLLIGDGALAGATLKIRAGAVAATILELQDAAQAVVAQWRDTGDLYWSTDVGVKWPDFAITEDNTLGWFVICDPLNQAIRLLALTQTGALGVRGNEITIGTGADAVAQEQAALKQRAGNGASVSSHIVLFDPTFSRVEFVTSLMPSVNVQWHLGEFDGVTSISPELWFNGASGAVAKQARFRFDAGAETLYLEDPNAHFDVFQIAARVALDVDDQILAAKNITLNGAVDQVIDKINAGDLRIGTSLASEIQFFTDSTDRWAISATGALVAAGGGALVKNALDPVDPQDLATKAYADSGGEPAYNVTTADATPTALATLAVADLTGERTTITVSARRVATAERGWFSRVVDVHREGGGASLDATTVTVPDWINAGFAGTIGIAAVGNTIVVTVTGVVAQDIKWAAMVQRCKVV